MLHYCELNEYFLDGVQTESLSIDRANTRVWGSRRWHCCCTALCYQPIHFCCTVVRVRSETSTTSRDARGAKYWLRCPTPTWGDRGTTFKLVDAALRVVFPPLQQHRWYPSIPFCRTGSRDLAINIRMEPSHTCWSL